MHTPSSSPQIRRAGPSDAQAVAAILTETYLTTWQPQLTPEAAMRFAQCDKIGDYVRSRLAEFHLACVNGTVAGMVDWENDFVWALHVSPRWQARGLGSTLLAHAEAAMAAAGHRRVIGRPGSRRIPSTRGAVPSTSAAAMPRWNSTPTKAGTAASPRYC
ncbi:MAG: N-acetyltransferase family protein [Cupriavidus sp.]